MKKTASLTDPHVVAIVGIVMVGAIQIAAMITGEDGTTMLPVVGAICLLCGYKLPDLVDVIKKK